MRTYACVWEVIRCALSVTRNLTLRIKHMHVNQIVVNVGDVREGISDVQSVNTLVSGRTLRMT